MNIIILFLSGLSFVWCTSYMALRNIILSAQKRNGAPPIMYEYGSIKIPIHPHTRDDPHPHPLEEDDPSRKLG